MTTKTRTVRRPQQIEESKMQGYFMISRRDASVAIANKLTGSQCRLWLYLMLIDPFADRTADGEIKYHDLPTIPEIAITVGSSPDTVEKDLRKLRKLGLYEYRTVSIQGYNSTAAKARVEAESLKSKPAKSNSSRTEAARSTSKNTNRREVQNPTHKQATSVDSDESTQQQIELKLSQDNESAYLSPDSAYLSPDSAYLSGNREIETLPNKDFSAPSDHSYQSNLFKSLSEQEREKFLEFANKKASELPVPPTLPGKWIEAHFEELHVLWKKHQSSIEVTHCGGRDSTNVLDFDNWDAINHEGQYITLMGIGLAKFCENKVSKAWYEWAVIKYPHKFVEVPE
ncbi:hypothetical protein [Calothrix sp. UHCC 0171]|uniref:hypothetical protein n=1 Tax=Calothrix sp. UHCC 0171 TaxID=3110245 RepID=UPI002B1FDD48|nr:hypothetical protein [Calothrix sp. UHCC 0171]MEA5574695.1 hypothetical protein [Calothrix sp. UHCC 0171]